ncbi:MULTISPECIES: hypothetical protein [unclassified Rhizobacter]|uniref:hypothetical protein n=1 Tax=unclassified Rhizobacter TaxID=2640088 RepID=UPI0006FE12BE|nr:MULTISPECIES: hypothetical protein [unclassified Rhizobacter]KQU69101.1 hypothetical protein ASC88_28615 [Rhizobacter sp. Root29]KQW03905.1 hypothetical protein ASC98_26785 [Rhizobacter sp. Root1238]KRB21544.1 hypothetical protein ASE08_21460 [Rhizobacter sp. Root16D2]
MNERSSTATPRPTTQRPQAESASRSDAPQRAPGLQRTPPATAKSRSEARHATRVAAENEVLIVGV